MYENINFTIPTDLLTYRLVWGMRIILKYEKAQEWLLVNMILFILENTIIKRSVRKIKWGWYEEEESWAFNV